MTIPRIALVLVASALIGFGTVYLAVCEFVSSVE